MNDFDDQLAAALGAHDRSDAGATPSAAVLDGVRERGLRRRRQKFAALSVASVIVLGAGVAFVGRDGNATIQTAPATSPSVPASPPSVPSPATSVPVTTLPPTTLPPSTTMPPSSTTPATTGAPAEATTSTSTTTTTAPTTIPPTTTPPTTSSSTPPTTSTTTTVPAVTIPPEVPLTVVPATAPVTSATLDTVSLEVTGNWAGAAAEQSMLARHYRYGGSTLAVLENGTEVVSVTMDCLPAVNVCSGDPWGWVVGDSLWVHVDDIEQQVVFEVDLATGTMIERMRGSGTVYDMVAVGDAIRFVVAGDQTPFTVAEYADGRVAGLFSPPASVAPQATLKLDGSGTRVFVAGGSWSVTKLLT